MTIFLLVISIMLLVGAILLFTVSDEFACSKLTEEKYLKSSFYANTKLGFEEGLKHCKAIQNQINIIGTGMTILAIGCTSTSIVLFLRDMRQKGGFKKMWNGDKK